MINDNNLGISTDGYLKINETKGYAEYDPTPYSVLELIIAAYPLTTNDCLIDFGCGLGRVICFAVSKGCGHAIGIEINKNIYTKLSENIIRSGFSDKIKIQNISAEEVIIDPTITHCFFYNPFYLKYFIKVYNHIIRQAKRNTVLLILYDAALEYQAFLSAQPNVTLDTCLNCGDKLGKVYVYKVRTGK